MAIAFDSSETGSVPGSTGVAYNHDITNSGVLYICVYTNKDISHVRYDGIDATLISSVGVGFKLYIYALSNPPTGVNEVNIGINPAGSILAVSVAIYGSESGFPSVTEASFSGNSDVVSDSFHLNFANSWTLEAQASDSNVTTTQDSGQTERDSIDIGNTQLYVATKSFVASVDTTLGFTLSAATDYNHLIIEIPALGQVGNPNGMLMVL